MFCGSTGVGKTQLAKCLSEDLFGRSDKLEHPLIRLDMSEYNGWDGVDRLMLASNGEISKWLGRLRTRPMSVVLLDEFEKASPEVHDCWLSALDEGRLTDRFGRTTTLCGAIIIMTTNVGGTSSGSIGFVENQSTRIHQAIEAEFRPEFLNRIDEILIFEPLSCATIREIVVKELNELSQREIIRSRCVHLSFSKSLVDRLVAIGFDPQLGARPLQRTIEREVVAVIARRLLEHHNDGPLTIEL
jgi:ATP-dependent Clp protease ATP-binding subunit ClpA